MNPNLQSQIWIAPKIAALIVPIVPLGTFMVGFGALQVLVGLSIISGYMFRFGLLFAVGIQFGIIINLFAAAGFNDVVLRDIVILTGIIYMLML